MELGTGNETRLTTDGSDTVLNGIPSWVYWEEILNHDDAAYWWSPDSSALAFLRSDESAVSLMSFVDFQPAVPVSDRRYYDTKYAEAYMKTPTENASGYDEVSLVERARDLHGRLLLAFGSYDDNVHPQNSLHFVDELIAAQKPFEMMVYPMRKHDIADRAARRDLYGRMLAFWKRWL